ncbi:thiamine pyrophosphate-requiring protein [Nannocystis pusilla]|uniref:Thiamine pyrophosphate-requiring protein n=1 Tax=Nannocystis pusilla TaxID=889268 RepID=A0ABS7TND9_9BACT|nr:thiamine pyrophosphate-requiring protein [Nannocystis pusilla]MBZ5709740.1 thiamine pyrophosphate-requiring protein [Nannocystis pusilla]
MPRIHTALTQGGDELVVFLHAVGGDHSSWRPQVEALRARYSTLTFDMRGHARSFTPDRPEISIQNFADDAIDLVEEAGFYRAHFVGLSMGGVVAQEIFSRAPERVQSLTLAATWCFQPEAAGRSAWMQDKLARMSMAESAAMDMPDLYARDAPPEMIEAAVAIEGGKDKQVFLQSWHAMLHVDYRELLPRIDVPVLLLGGSDDRITPVDPLLLDILARTPMAELRVISGGGHFCNLDRAEAFNAALVPFLRRARARAPQALTLPANPPVQSGAATVAEALLDQLHRRDVPVLFSNSGTDFTPLIEALARPGAAAPQVVAAAHENTAIAMAHGYNLLSGHVPAVMAHVNVGTANSGLGIINARRARVPMLVMAGLTPYTDAATVPGHRTNFVQWGQDSFDQAAYFREFTKWDYRLATAEHLEVAVDRALAVADSDPAGPVYLTLPKEVLCAPASAAAVSSRPRLRPTPPARPDAVALARVAQAIRNARRPLILTAELGRYRGGPEALWQLATRHGIGVVEFGKRNFFNLATDCPAHLGFDPALQVPQADLILAIEDPVPFIPAFVALPQGQVPPIVQIGVDPLFSDLPLRGFPSDLALPGDPAESLRLLTRLLDADPPEGVAARRDALRIEHDVAFAGARAAADADAHRPAITKRWLSRCVGQAVDDEVVVFNEYPLDPMLVPRRLPDSWFENSIASGLGWALGAALGGKLARPDRTIVATVGDGSFLFNTPLSALHAAAAHRLPILVVVFNDCAWSTIRKSTRGDFPGGHAQATGNFALCDLGADPAYDQIASACGGVGVRVDRPDAVPDALRRGLELIRGGDRFVLLDVRCERDA